MIGNGSCAIEIHRVPQQRLKTIFRTPMVFRPYGTLPYGRMNLVGDDVRSL